MNDQRIDVTNMMWQPEMIRLTQIGNPEIDNGKSQPMYIDPSTIKCVRSTMGAFRKAGTDQWHESVPCTEVNCCHFVAMVVESPEQVAMLRNAALGYQQKVRTIK